MPILTQRVPHTDLHVFATANYGGRVAVIAVEGERINKCGIDGSYAAVRAGFQPVAGGEESGAGRHEGREAAETTIEVPICT